MKSLKTLTFLLSLFTTSVFSSPNLTSEKLHCADLETLPIYEFHVINRSGDLYNNSSGTTWLIDKDTWMTAAHVVGEFTDDVRKIFFIDVKHTFRNAEIEYINYESDIAIFKADSENLIPLDIVNDIPKDEESAKIFTLGFPSFGGKVIQSYSGFFEEREDSGIKTSSFSFSGMSGGPALFCDKEKDLKAFGVILSYYEDNEVISLNMNQEEVYFVGSHSGYSYIETGILDLLKSIPTGK